MSFTDAFRCGMSCNCENCKSSTEFYYLNYLYLTPNTNTILQVAINFPADAEH